MSMSDPDHDHVTVALKQIRPVTEGLTLEHCAARLDGAQNNVLYSLMTGESFRTAAKHASVHRMTIYRWLKTDPYFKAAYNIWQNEARESARNQLLFLTEQAMANIRKALEEGDRKLSYQLLKDLGYLTKHQKLRIEPGLLQRELENECRRDARTINAQALQQALTQAGVPERLHRRLLRLVHKPDQNPNIEST